MKAYDLDVRPVPLALHQFFQVVAAAHLQITSRPTSEEDLHLVAEGIHQGTEDFALTTNGRTQVVRPKDGLRVVVDIHFHRIETEVAHVS